MSAPRIVAVIPARGGSVSIPKKNIKLLCGRPLIDWVVKPALRSGVFAEVWVSTDDDSIAAIAVEIGAKVHRRAAATATNTASTESAMADFVAAHPEYDILCLIQATSPFVVPEDFVKGLAQLRADKADSLVTAVRTHRFMWRVDAASGEASAKNYEPLRRPRRQDWDGELIENGAFYLTRKAVWERHACRLGGKIALYEMAEHTMVELDSPTDWAIVTHLALEYGYWPPGSRPPVGAPAAAGPGLQPQKSQTTLELRKAVATNRAVAAAALLLGLALAVKSYRR